MKGMIFVVLAALAAQSAFADDAPHVFRVTKPGGGISSNTEAAAPAPAPTVATAAPKKALRGGGRKSKLNKAVGRAGGTGGAKSASGKRGPGGEGSDSAENTAEAGDIGFDPNAATQSAGGLQTGTKKDAKQESASSNLNSTGTGGSGGGGGLAPAGPPPAPLNATGGIKPVKPAGGPIPSGEQAAPVDQSNSAF